MNSHPIDRPRSMNHRCISRRPHPSLKQILSATLLLPLMGCASPPRPKAPSIEKQSTPHALARLLPLEDRTVSNFSTKSDLGDEGRFVLEIFRPRPELAELKIAGRVQRLVVEEERISVTTGGTLLELPLEEGHRFQGPFGEVVIKKTDLSVTVPAGDFEGCILTLEESTSPPKRVESTYCPQIGLAIMVVESFDDAAVGRLEARLIHYGPRIELH